MTLPPLEEAVARLVTDLRHDALPPEALEGARRLMQDQLALQVGSASLPWSQALLALAKRSHVPGKARVAASGERMSAGDAAFVNGSYGHGFEYDDAHRASSSHPGSCVVPAALAVGEEIGATMAQVIEGIVAGYEVYTRIGNLAAPQLLERGWHPHAILSNFGAAAVVARMRGFDLERTAHALSIALSHASGTTEYTSSGGSIKRVHAGIGTRNGIRAAEMAEAGLTGPTTFLSGAKGFFRTFVQKDIPADQAALFGKDQGFEIAKVWIKPYCCCGINHAYIDGARQLANRADRIEAIELGIQTGGNIIVGNANANAYAPKTIEHLQYSLPFQFALSLLGQGNGYETHSAYMQGALDLSEGSEVARMAQRVKITVKPELDRAHPGKWVGDITARMADGAEERLFILDPLGTTENPVSQADLDAKFDDLTRLALGAEQSARLLATIKAGDPALPAAKLVALLIR
ncbi:MULTISPECIES: MmgE/PrpD family protein [Paracoccus]|uniref:2-methylcitrate dehydratase PrpD n=1 Tax=Paracoccus versutus TaxID=34007 RepID=A0A3D9XNG0_PARVE|nr:MULTISPECIES: MmgE/PrpD family protein [Paracoccus]REF71970.1 2-methylcitrate dehydratase PrpD [Paracoccus versutus]WGR56030.1 MmgE/PrpD family protein [Paracoccus versutus]